MHVVNSTDRPIRLGRCGENLVTQVKFDIARWLGELGDGTAVLLVQRPDDAEPYMAEVSRDGASVVWDVTAVDTASAGFGSCELQYIIGERIAKSAVFMTDVAAALGDPSEDAPDPFVAWEQRVVLASVAAQGAAAQIINMQVRAVTLEPDEEAYVQTAVVEDVYQMTFGIPRGHDGQGGGGTGDHSRLSNRDLNDQHPMEAITGLVAALLAKYVKPDGGIPARDLAEAVRSSLDKAESALQTAPVASVNGKTGDAVLTADDVGALPDDTVIPSLDGYATEDYVNAHHDNTKQNVIGDLATIRSGAALGATAVQPESGKGLFSGNYNDLTNKPTIPSLAGYATEAYVDSAITAAIGNIDNLVGSGVIA